METINSNTQTGLANEKDANSTDNNNESAYHNQEFVGAGAEHGTLRYARPQTDFVRASRYGRSSRAIINHEPGW